MNNLKWLFFGQQISVHEDILWGAVDRGWNIERSTYLVPDSEYTEEDLETVKKELENYSISLTTNFSAVVAEACHLLGKPYACWIYDCPQRALYRREALYDENIIFHFDKKEIARLAKLGIKNIHYLPLAANFYRTATLNISDYEIKNMRCDISFVGNLYDNAELTSVIDTLIKQFPNESNTMNQYMKSGLLHWDSSATGITDDDPFIDIFFNIIDKTHIEYYPNATPALWTKWLIAREFTRRERYAIMTALSQKYKTDIYTHDPDSAKKIPMLKVHPSVDYETGMYKVFFASKLNLNITLKSIESGVPQRIFDIMSVGGCVISNWQPEIEELFVPGKEILCFHSLDELTDLTKYYLDHNKDRTRIGIAGYQRAQKEYNYGIAAAKIEKAVSETIA